MRKSATWAPAPNLKVLAVERNETDWIIAVDGLDHATCPLCGIQSISRHSSCRRDCPGSFRAGQAGLGSGADDPAGDVETIDVKGGSSPSAFPRSPPRSRAEPLDWLGLSGFAATASADARRNR